MSNLVFPNAAAIARLRDTVRERLSVSLLHLVFDVFAPDTPSPVTRVELTDLVLNEEGFPSAVVFALHGAMVRAALKDDVSAMPRLLDILGKLRDRDTREPETIALAALSDADLHADDIYLLQAAFADDVGVTTTLVGPSAESVSRSEALMAEALAVLERTAPDWSAELALLSRQVLLAKPASPTDRAFGGAAVFDAFGAVLMNPDGWHDPSTVLMALIHEASHQHMFLFHLDDPVLKNDAAAVFASPLRAEPRPMEGVFHALWVSARMTVAADAVLKSPHRPTWASALRSHQVAALQSFRDCEKTVAEHADLTALGAKLFQDARDAVDAV